MAVVDSSSKPRRSRSRSPPLDVSKSVTQQPEDELANDRGTPTVAAPQSRRHRLQVATLSGAELPQVEVHSLQWVADVKRMLAPSARAPSRYLRLLYQGRELQDDKTMAEEDLPEFACLALVRCPLEFGSFLAIPDDDPLFIPYLTDCGADPNESDDSSGWTALHWAADRGHVAFGKALLVQKEFTALNERCMGGMSAIHEAAKNGHQELIQALATHPDFTQLNSKATNSNTVLHCAARAGHGDVCSALLELKEFKELNAQNFHGWTALHYTAACGLLSVCEKLLDHVGFSSAAAVTNNGETALHWAASNGRVEVCLLLLDRRVDPEIADVEGMVALDDARKNGHSAVCALLSSGLVTPHLPFSRVGPKVVCTAPSTWN